MAIPDINAMTDLETFGKRPGCVILSIALVPFHHNFPNLQPFYAKISVESSLAAGFTVDEETIAWWGNQPKEVYEEAITGGQDVREVFTQLSEYITKLPGNPLIWGCGSDFDNVIIKSAYEVLGMELPFTHYNNACFRTLRRLFKNKVNYVKPTMSHSALADAEAQAKQADKILTLVELMFSLFEDKTTSEDVVQLKSVDEIVDIITAKIASEIQPINSIVSSVNPLDNNTGDGSEATPDYVNQDR